MAILLTCRGISKSFGARPLFTNITIGVSTGERLGLIGPNGSGKTTLLKILAGTEKPDTGDVSRRRDLILANVSQNDELPMDLTVLEALEQPLSARPLEDYEKNAMVMRVAALVGFADLEARVDTLSGGWRKRLAIARAIIQEPEVVLFDEPTNHLDLEGILWLESFLKSAPFAFVLISHDRYFLENVTNRVVEMNRAYPEGYLSFEGAYSNFLVKKEEFLQSQAHLQHALEGKVKREVEWLRRGPQARTTKAQARIDAAHRLIDELAEVKYRNNQDRSADLDFTASNRRTRELLKARGISCTLGGKKLFSDTDVTLMPGTRLGLLGANGSGKSTMIRVLTGKLKPDTGTVITADNLKVVYFDQHRAPLNSDISLRKSLAPESDNITFRGQNMHVSGWARRFLFRPEQLEMPVGALSGGEQARVLIANLMLQEADILVLDEPTNDLDIPTLEVLEDTLSEFPGAIILVTHDRYMLDNVSTELLALGGSGGAMAYYADYSQWERGYQIAREAVKEPVKSAPAVQKPAPSRKLSTAEQRELAGMEALITAAEEYVLEVQAKMADPQVVSDHVLMDKTWKDLHAAQEKVAALYARWEELESRR
jgi:ABC transport system ATP-binding/permease protein